jgi:hydroxyethylthiazole kinase-like uncharacterized protein yjeF
MRTILSPDEMRALEARYFEETGVASETLMERAAQKVADELQNRLCGAQGKCAIFACGPGNNGGDGYAAARLFADRGGRALVLNMGDPERQKGDALKNLRRIQRYPGVEWLSFEQAMGRQRPDAWVDALFGIGLSRPVEGEFVRLMDRMEQDRAQGAMVLSVDIPSGLDGRSGRVLGRAVQADVTVSFECAKWGHLLGDGLDLCGELAVKSIGIPENMLPENAMREFENCDFEDSLPRRRRNSHKGIYGNLLLIAGSMGMAGAGVLAANAAMRSGVGLISVACPRSIVPILQQAAPCATCIPLPEENGTIAREAVQVLEQAGRGRDALAIGPGLSTRAAPEVVEWALKADLPAVLDADALNIISRNPQLKALLRPRHVITPHPGEAARLLGRAMSDPVRDVLALRDMGATALLKGASSLICGEKLSLSAQGSAGMAAGGSGDVLTGVIGALLAGRMPPERAALLGSAIHGRAGEYAEGEWGQTAMTAMDQIQNLSKVFQNRG